MFVIGMVASALAQSITLDAGNVLEPAAGTFYANGVGAPAVVWDENQQRFMMFFETRTAPADALCVAGYWSIGVATSEDGYVWEVWPEAVIAPTPGTAWSCYVAHPAVLIDESGLYHVFFTSGQKTDACAVSTPAWGCAYHPGIGKVVGTVELDDKSDEIAAKEAELAAIEQAIDDELLLLHGATEDFLAVLEPSTALECVNYADICSPCTTLTLSATHVPGGANAIDSVDLCQGFDFDTPSTLPVTEGSAGKSGMSHLRFGLGGADYSCRYKGQSHQALSPYIQEIAIGQCDLPSNPDHIELTIEGSSSNYPQTTVTIEITATNAQVLQGPGYDAIVGLSADAAALDEVAVQADAPYVQTVLADLRALLATLPYTVERADLDAAAATLEQALADGLANIDALEADAAVVQAELDVLYAYTQSVDLARVQDGPSLVQKRAGYPSVSKVAGTWHLHYAFQGTVWGATSAGGDTFSGTGQALTKGTVTWAPHEFYSPSLTCGPTAGAPDRHQVYVGGRETVNGKPGTTVVDGGIGDSISPDFVTWFTTTTPWASFVGNTAWRHLEALESGSVVRFWLSEIDAGTGKSVIRHGATAPVTDVGADDRICD